MQQSTEAFIVHKTEGLQLDSIQGTLVTQEN